ncbi:alpha/beta hydrolase [Pseudomonadota bacterium]|nr:alpha/beta hydrolase [Pseudomonadota bacterium]
MTGLGAQLTLWPEFLIKDLQANNFRPIVFDNRDVGLSTRFTSKPSQTLNYLKYFMFIPINSEYTIQDMASDGIAVLDHLNIDDAHILGMSMGGNDCSGFSCTASGKSKIIYHDFFDGLNTKSI